jgi:YNFM family putative membrane transporter
LKKLDKTTAATMVAGLCTFLNIYTTQPLLPLLRETFHASELKVSLTVSATIFATALVAPFIGMIAERRGRKKVIVPSLFLLTIPTALAATSTSLGALIFWRFAQGLFVPGVIAVMLAYVNEEWAGRGVGRAMSSYVTGTVIGGFLGRFISGVIATHWQWRFTFLVLAALNLIGAFVVRAWLPLAKNFVPAEHLRQVLDHAREHLRNLRLLANFGMGATALFGLVGCFTYANFYLAAAPFYLNSAQLGSIFFVYLLGVVITPQSGRFLDRFGFRHTTVLYCAMMIAGLLFTLVKSLPMVIVGFAIFSSVFSWRRRSHGGDGRHRRARALLGRRTLRGRLLSGRKRGRHADRLVLALERLARLRRPVGRSFVAELVAGPHLQPSPRATRLHGNRTGRRLKCGASPHRR